MLVTDLKSIPGKIEQTAPKILLDAEELSPPKGSRETLSWVNPLSGKIVLFQDEKFLHLLQFVLTSHFSAALQAH